MLRKPRITATVPVHVLEEITRYAKPLELTSAEYLGSIAKWWYAKGCPAVTEHEEEVRKRHPHARRAS